MNFEFSADQLALAETVRGVLVKHCGPQAVRAAIQDGERLPAWRELAEVGLFGLLVPEEHDGLGLGMVDAVLAIEETGRAVLPGPLAETMAAASMLPASMLADMLSAGKIVVSASMGDQAYAVDADLADVLIVDCHIAAEVRLTPHSGVDPTRRLFTVEASLGQPIANAVQACRLATVATAAQLLGAGRHLLGEAVDYAKARRQFGTPIGTFQAVKHHLADARIALEFAAPMVYRAAYTLADRDVAAAKAMAGEAAERVARIALQVHGAIGYTDELDLRLWLTRVWSLSKSWGGTALHRRRLRAAIIDHPVRTP